jgi:hypothetical protein
MWRPEMRIAVRLKKPATGFPARAIFFDVEHMPVICPTGQVFLRPDLALHQSSLASHKADSSSRLIVRPVLSLTVIFSNRCCSSSNTLLTASEAVAQEIEISPAELLASIVNDILPPVLCAKHSTDCGSGAMGRMANRRPIQKARDRLPGAGFILGMLNICR